jgi:hypothetical protein
MRRLGLAVGLLALLASDARAEDVATPPPAGAGGPTEAGASAPAPASGSDEDDLEMDPSEPDFTVVTLPTTLRLPEHKLAFRLTHRFTRPLGEGDFGDLLADFFGFDSSARIGLELRFAAFSGNQLGFYRTSDRTIELFASQSVLRSARAPVGLAVHASIEGLDNFSESYSPSLGVIVSRRLGSRGAVYLHPSWVGSVRLGPGSGDEDSWLLGFGARLRVLSRLYLVGETVPRVAGYKGTSTADTSQRAPHHASFGIEGRAGGHAFQINFSNGFGTTPAQVARGGRNGDDWYIGFNISRKFF